MFVQSLLLWKKNDILWVCVCILRCPACNVRVTYCHLWPVQLYNIFSHLINGTIFEKKKITEHKIFYFLYKFIWKILPLRRIQWDIIINVQRSSCKLRIILLRFLWNLNFLDIFPKKYLNIKFRENPSIGRCVAAFVLTDGQTDMTKLAVAFRILLTRPKT